MEEQKQTQLEIDLSHEVAQGTYANLTIIAHSTSEFIIDFIRLMPGVTKPEVKSRIILTPENAKRLMLALQDNIWKYEQDNEDTVCEYVNRLKKVSDKVSDKLMIIPRVYTNKPRTTGDGYNTATGIKIII